MANLIRDLRPDLGLRVAPVPVSAEYPLYPVARRSNWYYLIPDVLSMITSLGAGIRRMSMELIAYTRTRLRERGAACLET